MHFAESGATLPRLQSLSIHTGIVAIVNDFETTLISLNCCVLACVRVCSCQLCKGLLPFGGGNDYICQCVFTVARV